MFKLYILSPRIIGFTYFIFFQELSPNVDAEVELSFRTGDVIVVYGDMDDDGFYMAELRGQRGLVPSNFLADAPNQGKSLLGGMLHLAFKLALHSW